VKYYHFLIIICGNWLPETISISDVTGHADTLGFIPGFKSSDVGWADQYLGRRALRPEFWSQAVCGFSFGRKRRRNHSPVHNPSWNQVFHVWEYLLYPVFSRSSRGHARPGSLTGTALSSFGAGPGQLVPVPSGHSSLVMDLGSFWTLCGGVGPGAVKMGFRGLVKPLVYSEIPNGPGGPETRVASVSRS